MSVQGLAPDIPWPAGSAQAAAAAAAAAAAGLHMPPGSSDAAAAWHAQAQAVIQSHLREIEARATLAALGSMPSQPGGAASSAAGGEKGGKTEGGYASVLGAVDKVDASAPKASGSKSAASAAEAAALSLQACAHSSVGPETASQPSAGAPAAGISAISATGGNGGGGIKPTKAGDAADKSIGTLEVRKKNDRDKKRRKRGRIGNLVRELDNCLPPPSCNRQRSINETLRDVVQAVKARLKHVEAGGAAVASAAAGAALADVASARQGQGDSSSSAAVAVHNLKDIQEQLQSPPPPPPQREPQKHQNPLERLDLPSSKDERKSGKKATGPTMSEVMFAAQDGIALITRDLTIVDANVAFATLVVGKHKADLALRRRNAGTAPEQVVPGTGGGGKAKDPSGASKPKSNRMVGSNGTGALAGAALEGGARGGGEGVARAAPAGKLFGGAGAASGGAHAEEGAASAAGEHHVPRATGHSLSAFLWQNDARRLAAALTHLANEVYADEGLRRCVLGLRFKGHELEEGSPPAGGVGVPSGGDGCRGAARLPAQAVEVVPCGGSLLGKLYFLFASPPADDSSPAAIFGALRFAQRARVAKKRALYVPQK
jgi:hypothetical protein